MVLVYFYVITSSYKHEYKSSYTLYCIFYIYLQMRRHNLGLTKCLLIARVNTRPYKFLILQIWVLETFQHFAVAVRPTPDNTHKGNIVKRNEIG